MSIDFMNRVWWREDLPTMEKFVLLALADAANDDEGLCYPAVATIALKCSCSVRTVQNAIRGLAAKQLLRVMPRKDRSSYYVLNRSHLPHVERERRTKERGPQHDLMTGAGAAPDLVPTGAGDSATGASDTVTGAGAAPRTIREPSEEPSLTDSEIVEAWIQRWNALANEVQAISAIHRIGDKRKASLLARVAEYEPARHREPVEALLDRVVTTIRGSRFLRGEKTPFKADPAWATTPTYFPKLEETGYAQDATAGGGGYRADDRDRSHVAAGQAARDILRAGGTAPRRSARELAGLPPRRPAHAG